MIVHHPRYKLRGQIRLKDTTLSLGLDLLSNYCLHCRFASFMFFGSGLNKHDEQQVLGTSANEREVFLTNDCLVFDLGDLKQTVVMDIRLTPWLY